MKSGTWTGVSLINIPSLSDAAITRSPAMLPPPMVTVKHPGQWARPPLAFTSGVRPNSPVIKTIVESSMPRSAALGDIADHQQALPGQLKVDRLQPAGFHSPRFTACLQNQSQFLPH